jgi:NAD(P)-dependent dehydrogenase (short-subunit alcohol dehydrogenase family)
VNVSSAGQQPIDFGGVMLTRGYSGTRAYCQSKLAQIMFIIDLGAALEGTGVTVTCLHPARIRLPPTGDLQNAAERLDTGKLSSGSEENQNILIDVSQITLRRQCKRVYPPVVALALSSGKAVASRPMEHGVPMRDLIADWKKWSRAERVLAVMGTLLMVALPLGLLMTG